MRNDLPYDGEVRLGHRLLLTAVLLATILAHGGAAVSAGMGLATVSEWSRRKIAGVVAVAVLAALVLPFIFFVLNGGRPLDAMGGSFAMAMSSVLTALVTRKSFSLDEIILSVAAWDIATALFGLGLLWWTVRFWQRQFIGESRAKTSPVRRPRRHVPDRQGQFRRRIIKHLQRLIDALGAGTGFCF